VRFLCTWGPRSAPRLDRVDERHEGYAGVGQFVLDPRRHLAVTFSSAEAVVDQLSESRGELPGGRCAAGWAGAEPGELALDLGFSPGSAVEDLYEHQRPAIAGDVERLDVEAVGHAADAVRCSPERKGGAGRRRRARELEQRTVLAGEPGWRQRPRGDRCYRSTGQFRGRLQAAAQPTDLRSRPSCLGGGSSRALLGVRERAAWTRAGGWASGSGALRHRSTVTRGVAMTRSPRTAASEARGDERCSGFPPARMRGYGP